MRRPALCFAVVLACATAAIATPASTASRFQTRTLPSAAGDVSVAAKANVFAVRFDDVDVDAVAVIVGDIVQKANPALGVSRVWALRDKQAKNAGLVAVSVDGALDAAAFDDINAGVVAAGGLAWPALTRENTGSDNRAFVDDHLVVTFAAGAARDTALQKVLAVTGGHVVHTSKWLEGTVVVKVGAAVGFDAVDAAAAVAGLAGVAAAEPNLYRELELLATTNDPLFPDQWHLARNADQGVPGTGTINADVAWDTSKGDPDVVVSVFDSGTEWDHEDLVENVRQDLMFDASDDGDVDPSPECEASQDGIAESPLCGGDTPFRESHGTAVSGTVAARGDNNLGLTGVCPQCSLAPVRLLGAATNDALSIAEAFSRACDPTGDGTGQGAWVINNSWGPGFSQFFPLSTSERNAFDRCRSVGRGGKGTVIVFAAGNSTANVASDAYAKHPSILGVAASTNLDDWAAYSNYGEEIDIAAPSLGGTVNEDNFGIVTADVSGNEGYSIDGNGDGTDYPTNYTNSFSGTSAASPVVAGLCGLILSVNPDLTSEQVRLVLTTTADKIRADKVDWAQIFGQDLEALFDYDDNGHSIAFGYGRINAAAAIALVNDPVALAATLGSAGQVCTADADGCACNAEGFCETACTVQDDCVDGTVCNAGRCELPRIAPGSFLEPCTADCAFCVTTIDTEFQETQVCSKTCTTDDECDPRCADGDPECTTDSFDCRPISADPSDPSICAAGPPNSGGPADFGACGFNPLVGLPTLVLSDEGKELCGVTCFSDGAGSCPYGFHCAESSCDCTRLSQNGGCRELTCVEGFAGEFEIGPMCVPNPGHADVCTTDRDCQFGDYCEAGTCVFDDRAGCDVCESCTDSSECAGRGICLGDGGDVGVCTLACDDGEACPGNTECRTVIVSFFGREREARACVSPEGNDGDFITNACAGLTCQVAECRDGRPCGDGEVCVDGVCEDAPDENPDPTGPSADQLKLSGGGLRCAQGGNDPALVALVGAVVVGLRRRRR